MKTETTSLPIEIFDLGVYQEYFYLAAFMAVLLGGIFYKFKAGNTVPQHPFKIYQDADRKANRSLQEGEVNRALGIYQEALHQIEPIAENIEEDSSSKQVAWILHKKIEELKFEMEEK